MQKLIQEYEKNPVSNPPLSISQYEYNGHTVYYVPPRCCDIPSILYSENGEVICAPDGGMTGRGDGKCPDFYEKKKNRKLIWKDER